MPVFVDARSGFVAVVDGVPNKSAPYQLASFSPQAAALISKLG